MTRRWLDHEGPVRFAVLADRTKAAEVLDWYWTLRDAYARRDEARAAGHSRAVVRVGSKVGDAWRWL